MCDGMQGYDVLHDDLAKEAPVPHPKSWADVHYGKGGSEFRERDLERQDVRNVNGALTKIVEAISSLNRICQTRP
jgi:hypothetical protein